MIQLFNVKGFEGIRIHAGNTAEDTEGCLITGTSVSLTNSSTGDPISIVEESRVKTAQVFKLVQEALLRKETVSWSIVKDSGRAII